MESLLKSLLDIEGVLGATVFDKQNKCLACQMPSPYEPILLTKAMQEIRESFQVFSYLDPEPVEMLIAQATEGTLICRQSDEHTVMLLIQRDAQSGMLYVGLNVAMMKLKSGDWGEHGKARRSGGQHRSRSWSRRDSASDSWPGRGRDSVVSDSVGARPVLNETASGSIRLNGSTSTKSVTGAQDSLGVPRQGASSEHSAISSSLLLELRSVLEKFMGPYARPTMKEELVRLGAANGRLRVSYDELVALLSRRVEIKDRRKFADEARSIPLKYK